MDKSIYLSSEEIELWRLAEKVPSLLVMEKLVLASESNIRTKLDIDLTPYLRMPVQCIGDNRFFILGMIGPTQAGKSTFLQIAVADMIDQAPGTALYVLPDRIQGQKQIREKIVLPLQRTPSLARHILQPEHKSLTADAIKLDHMTLYLGWSNSPASLSSTNCTRVFFDEARLFKKELGNESNPIMLGLDRLTVARLDGLAQAYIVSTPSDEGDLLYQQLQVPNTTVLHWYWQCQDCGSYQIPDFFVNLKKPEFNDLGEVVKPVRCECRYCGTAFPDTHQKRDLNSKGKYGFFGQDGTKDVQLGQLTDRLFFWFDSMSSPFRPFSMIWEEYVRTKKHVNDYKNFQQAWLAKFWKITLSSTTASDLIKRKSIYYRGVVPDDTLVITAGIDAQDDGFYVVVRAWGAQRHTWMIDEFFISAKIDELTPLDLAGIFSDQVERRVYLTTDGVAWGIAHYAIDTGGHRTKEIYSVAENLTNMLLVKGRDSQTETIIISKKILGLYSVRTGDYLEETEQACNKAFWHLHSDVSEDFLTQWVSAKKTYKISKQTNLRQIVWFKEKQNDYRYADVHSYIALDIPWNNGTLRRNLDQPDWEYNPLEEQIKSEAHAPEKKMMEDRAPFSPQTGGGFDFSF